MSKKDAAEKYFSLVSKNIIKKITKLGEQKYNKKDYQGAIADLDKVIELNPKYFDAYNNRGVVKGKLKQHKKAIADFDKAIKLNPKDAQAYYNRGVAKKTLKQYKVVVGYCRLRQSL